MIPSPLFPKCSSTSGSENMKCCPSLPSVKAKTACSLLGALKAPVEVAWSVATARTELSTCWCLTAKSPFMGNWPQSGGRYGFYRLICPPCFYLLGKEPRMRVYSCPGGAGGGGGPGRLIRGSVAGAQMGGLGPVSGGLGGATMVTDLRCPF